MTAVAVESVPAPAPPKPRQWLLAARILRTEIRHSAFVWCLPLLVVLFIYDPYRTAAGYPALWPLRSRDGAHGGKALDPRSGGWRSPCSI